MTVSRNRAVYYNTAGGRDTSWWENAIGFVFVKPFIDVHSERREDTDSCTHILQPGASGLEDQVPALPSLCTWWCHPSKPPATSAPAQHILLYLHLHRKWCIAGSVPFACLRQNANIQSKSIKLNLFHVIAACETKKRILKITLVWLKEKDWQIVTDHNLGRISIVFSFEAHVS